MYIYTKIKNKKIFVYSYILINICLIFLTNNQSLKNRFKILYKVDSLYKFFIYLSKKISKANNIFTIILIIFFIINNLILNIYETDDLFYKEDKIYQSDKNSTLYNSINILTLCNIPYDREKIIEIVDRYLDHITPPKY